MVLAGVRNTLDHIVKVSNNARKVSDGVGKVSFGFRNVSDCV